MLERQDGAARVFVVAHDGTGLVEGRRSRVAAGAERGATRIELERQPAALAHRPVEELDRLPALGAERAGLGDLGAAGYAQRRKQQIERRPPGASDSLLQLAALQSPAHVL